MSSSLEDGKSSAGATLTARSGTGTCPVRRQAGTAQEPAAAPACLPHHNGSSGSITKPLVAMEIQIIMSSKSNCGDAPVANVKSRALHRAVTHPRSWQSHRHIVERWSHSGEGKNPVLCIKRSGETAFENIQRRQTIAGLSTTSLGKALTPYLEGFKY